MGVYAALFQRRVHVGITMILLGALWLVVGIGLIIPYHGGSHASAYMTPYRALGDNWLEILLSPFLHPLTLGKIVFSPTTANYLILVLAPFGFLPLLAPSELVLAIPPLAVNVLSDQSALRSGLYHYEALLVPALYVAFVAGLGRVMALSLGAQPAVFRRIAASLVVFGLTIFVLASAMRHRSIGRPFLLDIDGDPARAELDAIVARVPPDVPVVSPQHVQPYVSNRTVSAYLNNVDDFADTHPPFHYAVLPAYANRPPAEYELVWEGATYSLYRRKG
jgi:uncharacterized membrane protein